MTMHSTSVKVSDMRLTEKQQTAIINTFREVFAEKDAELWLFGSRVDDSKRGGDIDLLIKCYTTNYNELWTLRTLEWKYGILLQKQIGPRKIDTVLEFSQDCKNRPIVIQVKETGILLAVTASSNG